jgi:hypothetical protein
MPETIDSAAYLAEYRRYAIRDSKSDKRPNVAYVVVKFPCGRHGSEQRFDGQPMCPVLARLGAVEVETYRRGKLVATS